MATTEPQKPPVKPTLEWDKASAAAGCVCTDPDRMECCNFEVPCAYINGEDACTCVCHKLAEASPPHERRYQLWEDVITMAKRANRVPTKDAALLLSAALLDWNAALMCGGAKLPASWRPVAAHAAGYETDCGEVE